MNSAEQNPATNPLLETPPNAPANNADAADPSISAFPRKHSHRRWIFLAAFVVLAVAGAFLWHYLSGFESTDDAQVDVHLYPVSARISGYVQKVHVDDNQWVDEGSTLVEIDPKDYEVALARSQAALDTSEAAAKSSNIDVPISSVVTSSQLKSTASDIKNAEASIQAAEKRVAAAHARVLEAEAENMKAQDDVTRYHLLLTKEELPKQVYDHAYAAAVSLVIWEWFREQPIIDVRMFKSFNFAAANLMMFMMGFMLFSTLVLIPEYLQTLMGYTSELAGLVLSGGGVVLLVMMPVVGRLTSKVQARWLIATGWLCLAIGLFYCAHEIDLFVSFRFAMWLRVAQVIGIGFLFVPITAAGYNGVPPDKGNSVSGMINFMRNIGGSIGTSVVTTMIARRAQYHQQILVAHITPDSPEFRSAFHALSSKIAHSGLRTADARDQAIARLYGSVHQQGGTLSYMDIFWVLGALCSIMFVLAFFLRKNDPGAGGEVAVG
jgi:hypothetical protein